MAPSCFNMSSCRAIWTHFRSNSMILFQQYTVLGLGTRSWTRSWTWSRTRSWTWAKSWTWPRSKNQIFSNQNHGIWSEMGPYGSIWAHIKTGRSPMAQHHFQTPPDPKRGYKRPQNQKKSKKVCVTSAKRQSLLHARHMPHTFKPSHAIRPATSIYNSIVSSDSDLQRQSEK